MMAEMERGLFCLEVLRKLLDWIAHLPFSIQAAMRAFSKLSPRQQHHIIVLTLLSQRSGGRDSQHEFPLQLSM